MLLMLSLIPVMSGIGAVSAQSLGGPVKEIFQKDGTKNELFQNTDLKDYTGSLTDLDEEQRYALENGGQYQLRNVVLVVIGFMQQFMIPVAVLLLVFAGVQLIASRGSDEALTEKKSQLTLMALGFLGIILSVTLVDFVFFGQEGEILRANEAGQIDTSQFAGGLDDQVRGVFEYISTFFIAVAILILIASVIQIAIGGSDEDAMKKIKKRIGMSGLAVFIMVGINQAANLLSRGVQEVTLADGNVIEVRELALPSSSGILEFVGGWTNFVLTFVSVGAIIALIWAGVRLVSNFGDEEAMAQTKKTFLAVLLGLVLLFSAYAIVATVIGNGGMR